MDYDENCTEEELNDDCFSDTMQVVETSEIQVFFKFSLQVFHDTFKLLITQLQAAASNRGGL